MLNQFRAKQRDKRFRKQANRALVMLWRLDISMRGAGWSRQRRRQFWRDFIKSPKLRDQVFGEMIGLK